MLSLILILFRDQVPNILTCDMTVASDHPDISPGGACARRAARLDALGPEGAREPREAAVTAPGVRSQVAEMK